MPAITVHALSGSRIAADLVYSLPVGALTQTETGTVTGTVTDRSNAGLPGVAVTLTSRALIGGSRTTTTTGTGGYKFIALQPGSYDLKYELAGSRGWHKARIPESAANFIATVNISMGVEAVAETVSVIGESPVVDSKSALVATTLDKGLLDNIPTGRDIWVLTEEVAGRFPTAITWAAPKSAQRARCRNPRRHRAAGLQHKRPEHELAWRRRQLPDVLLRLRQLRRGPGRDGRRAGGGQRRRALRERDHQVGQRRLPRRHDADVQPGKFQGNNVTDALKAQGITTAKPIERIVDFEPTLGGPISKRAWFFGSYRDVRDQRPAPRAPGWSERRHQPSEQCGKVTAQVHPEERPHGAALLQRSEPVLRRDNGYAFTTQDASWQQIEPAHLIQGRWTSVLSKALFLDVRFGYLHRIFPLGPQSTAAGISKIDDILSTVPGRRRTPDQPGDTPTDERVDQLFQRSPGGRHARIQVRLRAGTRWLNAYDYSCQRRRERALPRRRSIVRPDVQHPDAPGEQHPEPRVVCAGRLLGSGA